MSYYITQSNFLSGEITKDIVSRGDLRAYKNGLSLLRNMNVLPTGGIERREGSIFVAKKAAGGRLIPYIYNQNNKYLLHISDRKLDIYKNDSLVSSVICPWKIDDIKTLKWAYKKSDIIFVHKDYQPKILKRFSDTSWALQNLTFETSDSDLSINQPYARFSDTKNISLTPSGTTGTISIISSENLFTHDYVGTRLRLNAGEAEIIGFVSNTEMSAVVKKDLSGTTADFNWSESAFSLKRGYPNSVGFYQDRLVFGGSKSLPNRLWFSKTSDYYNFDLGEGLDNEAIEFNILSSNESEITSIFSAKHLQVFTTSSEWIVKGYPLTPSNVQVEKQTEIGSDNEYYIPHTIVDGASIFISSANEVREFLYTDLEQAYSATDITLLVKHLMFTPVDLAYDKRRKRLFVVMEDGSMAVALLSRQHDITSWFQYNTSGNYVSTVYLGSKIYTLVKRGNDYFIEYFSQDVFSDCAVFENRETNTNALTGLNHLEDKDKIAVLDGNVYEDIEITNGNYMLPVSSKKIEIGIPYIHKAAPLPPLLYNGVPPKTIRLIEVIFRVIDTYALEVDTGRGLKKITVNKFDKEQNLYNPPENFSKDIRIKALGWSYDFNVPLWKVESKIPLRSKILSVTYNFDSSK